MMVVAYTDCYRPGDGLTLLATTVHRSSDSDEHRRSHDHHQQNRTKKTYLIRLQWHRKSCRSGSVGCKSEGSGCRSEGVSSRSESCGTISESCGLPPVIFYWWWKCRLEFVECKIYIEVCWNEKISYFKNNWEQFSTINFKSWKFKDIIHKLPYPSPPQPLHRYTSCNFLLI